jgi:hypothetical protein
MAKNAGARPSQCFTSKGMQTEYVRYRTMFYPDKNVNLAHDRLRLVSLEGWDISGAFSSVRRHFLHPFTVQVEGGNYSVGKRHLIRGPPGFLGPLEYAMRLTFILLLFTVVVCSSLQALTWSKKIYPAVGAVVVRADFNGDGFPDLMIYGGVSTLVMLNAGDGSFDSDRILATNALSNAAVVDFNRDGKLDVVGCDGAGNLLILLGGGDGTLTLSKFIADGCAWVTTADFNRDGNPDIAVGVSSTNADSTNNQVIVYLGDGKGGISSQVVDSNVDFSETSRGASPCIMSPGSAQAADFDGDKIADIAIAAPCPAGEFIESVLIVGKGDGTGHFTFHKDQDNEWSASTNLRLGDINPDGRVDLYGIGRQSFPFTNTASGVEAFLGNGDGTFNFQTPVVVVLSDGTDGGSFMNAAEIADVDGDGIKDIVIGIRNGFTDDSFLQVYKGAADGSFHLFYSTALASGIGDMIWGDFAKDGREGLALIRPSSTDVWNNVTVSNPICFRPDSFRKISLCAREPEPGNFHIKSTPRDNLPINAMQIYIDSVLRFQTHDDLIDTDLHLTAGEHSITVKGWDDLGAFSFSNFLVSDGTPCPNTTNRTVKICSPANGAIINGSGSIVVNVIAGAATKLKFSELQVYVDGKLVFSSPSESIDTDVSMTSGTHRLTVKGWDSSGAFSSTETVTVQ